MKVLVIGNGGCEYVLVWKVVQSLLVETVFVVLGNVGIVLELVLQNVVIGVIDILVLLDFV